MTRLIYIFILSFIFACNADSSDKKKENNKEISASVMTVLYSPFVEIIPTSGEVSIKTSTGFATRSYSPTCTGVDGNKTFRFLVKKGTSKNLLINFMGGGACWDAKNCLGTNTPTYFNKLDSSPSYLMKFLFNGILDYTNSSNPMKDWNTVFIPYCSGDLHWGSNTVTYNHPTTKEAVTFHHKGFDNFLSVLKYLQTNEDFKPVSGSKILVIGQSAGGYGTLFNFPYIKESFPNSEVNAILDASNGVVTDDFQSGYLKNWNVAANTPSWISGISADFASGGDLGDIIYKIAQYYPTSRIGQYTTEYDGNQRYFYNVMLSLPTAQYNDVANFWGKGDGTLVSNTVSCDWRNKMRAKLLKSGLSSNYKYYIAGGDVHTITTDIEFYSESTGGITVRNWLNSLLENSAWTNQDCRLQSGGCYPPATSQSPGGLVCP